MAVAERFRYRVTVMALSMSPQNWTTTLRHLYELAKERYASGVRGANQLFNEEECAALAKIGARPIELYDYVEDAWAVSWETALLVMAVRRDYFLSVQKGALPTEVWGNPPGRNETLEGISWLPRLIYKAEARLRGVLHESLMYGCGGDRAFFKEYDLHPADFLRVVWVAEGDRKRIVRFVKTKQF